MSSSPGGATRGGSCSSCRHPRGRAKPRWSNGSSSACPGECHGLTRPGRPGSASRTGSTIISLHASDSKPWPARASSSNGRTFSGTTTGRLPPIPRRCSRAARTSSSSSTSRALVKSGRATRDHWHLRPAALGRGVGAALTRSQQRQRGADSTTARGGERGSRRVFARVRRHQRRDRRGGRSLAINRGSRARARWAHACGCGKHHRNVSFMKSTPKENRFEFVVGQRPAHQLLRERNRAKRAKRR